MRVTLTRLAVLALAALALASCSREGGDAALLPRPAPGASVVLLTLDTTRADRIGVFGRDGASTPNLDALGRAGAVFESAFSPVQHFDPLIFPTVSCCLFTVRERRPKWPSTFRTRTTAGWRIWHARVSTCFLWT